MLGLRATCVPRISAVVRTHSICADCYQVDSGAPGWLMAVVPAAARRSSSGQWRRRGASSLQPARTAASSDRRMHHTNPNLFVPPRPCDPVDGARRSFSGRIPGGVAAGDSSIKPPLRGNATEPRSPNKSPTRHGRRSRSHCAISSPSHRHGRTCRSSGCLADPE